MPRSERVRDRGTVVYRHDADALLERPGDVVLVHRGVTRSLVMSCPDGCGETLTINLDPRSGKAWRFYRKRNQLSLFPSVWRDTGCFSHFIVWNHHLLWCGDSEEDAHVEVEEEEALRERVLESCTAEWQHYTDLAMVLDVVPWDVNTVCRHLTYREKLLAERESEHGGYYRLR